nr:TonB-dependent receptor [uncultured Holophaga sp.]
MPLPCSRWVPALVAGSLLLPPLAAQSTGSTTADLRVILAPWPTPGLSLRLVSPERGQCWVLRPDQQGRAEFRLLPPGTYTLEVDAGEGRRLRVEGLTLSLGNTRELRLPPPATAEVPVEEGMVGAPGTWSLDLPALEGLPASRRNYTGLSLTTPLAAMGRGPTNPGAPDSGLSLAGAGPRQNSFLVDGLDNNDLGNGNSRLLVSQSAIQAFQVLPGGYSAELGRATGGVVNAILKTGTNRTEGSVFDSFSPGSLDARSPLAGSTHFWMHQYGLSTSGPILKDRLFYFACAERLDRSATRTVNIDPAVATSIRGAGFNLETGDLESRDASTSALLKLDWIPSPDNRWSARFMGSRRGNDSLIPWGGLKARSTGGRQDTRDLAAALTWQWIPSPELLRESRFMLTDRRDRLVALDGDRTVQVDLQGMASFGTQRLTPQDLRTRYLQWSDATTLVRGAHTLKAGVDWINTLNQGRAENNSTGYYLFQAIPTYGLSSSLASFLAGAPVAYVQSFGDSSTRFSTDLQSLYVQDEWRPAPPWTLQLGLRYDRERIPTFEDTPDYQALGGTTSSRLEDGAVAYSSLFRVQRNWTSARFSPRVSFTWEPTPRWKLHGGFGTFSGSTNLSPVFGLRTTNGLRGYGILQTILDANPYGPMTAWAQPGHRYSTAPEGVAHSLVIPGSHQSPVSRQQSLGLTWLAAPAWQLSLDLLHTKGSHLLNVRDVNAFVLSTAGLRRVDTRYSSIYRVDDSGASRYWAQTLGCTWTPATGTRIQASYCHSSARDNYNDWTGALAPENTFDPSSEWGPSFQDQRHRFLVDALWSGPETGNPWVRGWQVGARATLGSGRPYSRLAGSDLNNNGDGASDRVPGYGRNSEQLPWSRRIDLRLTRTFQASQVRWEASLDIFNLLNHANVTEVQNVAGSDSPPYGTPTDYEGMRQFQFGLRASY